MKDPRVLVALLTVRREVVGCVAGHVWWSAAAAAFAAAGWAAAAAWWRRRAAAALADRVAFELVPASTFQADPVEVRWFAGQIASVRTACGVLPRRASATRVRLTYEDSRVHYLLEGPARARSLLRMPGYQDVEVVAAGIRSRRPAVSRIRFETAQPAAGRSR